MTTGRFAVVLLLAISLVESAFHLSFRACHSVNFDPSLSHPSTRLVRSACTCFSTAQSTAKLGIIGASTDRLARHIAQEGASLFFLIQRHPHSPQKV